MSGCQGVLRQMHQLLTGKKHLKFLLMHYKPLISSSASKREALSIQMWDSAKLGISWGLLMPFNTLLESVNKIYIQYFATSQCCRRWC